MDFWLALDVALSLRGLRVGGPPPFLPPAALLVRSSPEWFFISRLVRSARGQAGLASFGWFSPASPSGQALPGGPGFV